MNITTDSRRELLRVLVELAQDLPPGVLSSVVSELESGRGGQDLARFPATQPMREKLRRLEELCRRYSDVSDQAIAYALLAAGEAARAVETEHRVEIAWTGPPTEAVPTRRVDQVLYEMVESAESEILLVTYAAYRADRVLATLRAACERGVRLKLVIELAEESGGKISFDSLHAFRKELPSTEIFFWALDRRGRDAWGAHGSMHAKCLLADRRLGMVSSANMTGYALELNMELGLLVRGAVAARLADHFDQLIVRGDLVVAP